MQADTFQKLGGLLMATISTPAKSIGAFIALILEAFLGAFPRMAQVLVMGLYG